jgi:hypothetical protein
MLSEVTKSYQDSNQKNREESSTKGQLLKSFCFLCIVYINNRFPRVMSGIRNLLVFPGLDNFLCKLRT